MTDATDTEGLDYLDPEAEAFYEGRFEDIETGIVEGGMASILVRPAEDRTRDDISEFLDENDYETGEPVAFESYSLDIDPDGLRRLIDERYVEAVEMVRPVHPPDGIEQYDEQDM